ncbi:class I SAM-dependent methyltransferase [Pendulispora albinea]|uniref:Class I SAM-dependent methyltransferase n=1 Tax=Pendulispora albinea TaxID=2741071 RepID=A0ABZ2MBT7_9BACT
MDHELLAGTTAHYRDPDYYTKTYQRRLDDVRYYVDIAAASGGPVLEYGCGNGRILLPVARRGVTAWGVDLSEAMLTDLERKLLQEPESVRARVKAKHGDMRKVRLGKRFPLIACPFNTFLHLYERADVERFLAKVKSHLAPKGTFVLDISIPDPSELSRSPQRGYRGAPFSYPGVGKVRYVERFDYDGPRQILFVSMEFEDERGQAWMTPLAHRQFYPRELEALLHYNGFKIIAQYGGFDGSPLGPDSDTLIVHARAVK